MSGELGDGVEEALTALVTTMETLPGAYRPEFTLTYWAGVTEAESWCCSVEGDIVGDDGDRFHVLAHTAAEGLRAASEEAWRRIPDAPSLRSASTE